MEVKLNFNIKKRIYKVKLLLLNMNVLLREI